MSSGDFRGAFGHAGMEEHNKNSRKRWAVVFVRVIAVQQPQAPEPVPAPERLCLADLLNLVRQARQPWVGLLQLSEYGPYGRDHAGHAEAPNRGRFPPTRRLRNDSLILRFSYCLGDWPDD